MTIRLAPLALALAFAHPSCAHRRRCPTVAQSPGAPLSPEEQRAKDRSEFRRRLADLHDAEWQREHGGQRTPPGTADTENSDLPYVVPFAPRDADFRGGDGIAVTTIRGDRPTLQPGGHYRVTGVYLLQSSEKASLCLWSTDGETQPEREPCQMVSRGAGALGIGFRIKEPMRRLHLSFYPAEGGDSLGGVYLLNPGSE